MFSQLLLSATYLPPVSYFHAIYQHDLPVVLDQYEHYPKQTYRTRAKIATASGILELFVPIVHGRKEHVAMKDIRINYDHDWQRLHWQSIQTAYRSSAYFEFYEDEFEAFYKKKYEFLFDYNLSQLELILKLLKVKRNISFTDSYEKVPSGMLDYRGLIHPKKPSVFEISKPYYQVFNDRTGFIPELSIIDLIFNQGPQSKSYL
ncbi:WbqC family protein [Sphingobacterium lumbrici]|uniref:WbqC family protein n=1 Tax=Sphingobacterium lumbrici TaxID=2559600 RepID=UPI001126E4DC|nr:WbqC family protein [Sphingobacterium lumbrici]